MSKMTAPEATLAIKEMLTNILVELGAEGDGAPTEDDKEAAREIVEVLWDAVQLRVISVKEVSGMIELGIPVNIFSA
jgi:hypothetical protein